MTTTQIRKVYSRTVRAAANASGIAYPIVRVDGDKAPTVTGESYHYTTQSGRLVRYPNAYRRVAKSAVLIYVGSERRIEVGRDWLLAHGLPCMA